MCMITSEKSSYWRRCVWVLVSGKFWFRFRFVTENRLSLPNTHPNSYLSLPCFVTTSYPPLFSNQNPTTTPLSLSPKTKTKTSNGRSCTLYNVHIGKNPHSGEYFQHEERRPRPLLLHKEETRKLAKGVEQKGFTIVPLKDFYSSRNQVKVQIGLCRGKNVMDKRNTIKDREMKKDADRMIKNFRAF